MSPTAPATVGSRRRDRALRSARLLLAWLLAAAVVIPLAVMFATSLKTQRQIFDSGFSWFFTPTLENYRGILESRFLGYIGNSIFVGLVATLLTLILGTMCAYALSRFQFIGRTPLALSTLLLRTIPPAVLAVPIYFIWNSVGLSGLNGLVLVYVALNLPFTIWLLYGFIEQVPTELEESAAVDGCGPFRAFFHLILPLLKPGLAAAAIFTFRISWNELVLSSILTNRTTRTLPYAVFLYIKDTGIDWGELMAAGVLIAIPPLLFTFVAARQIIAGLTSGAVKG
jgi:multiple sugar transport system permease protein